MTDIRINEKTTTDEIRRQLSGFGWGSCVEARIDESSQGKAIVLHEVTLGERLARGLTRLFQIGARRTESVARSRAAMNELADRRPAIRALLGASIGHKSEWAAHELRKALTAGLERLSSAERGARLAVPLQEGGQVGIVNAKVADIKADKKVNWRQGSGVARFAEGVLRSDEIGVVHPNTPTPEQMRQAYAAGLGGASGHVVIAPIKDADIGVIQSCSDQSLVLLLEAIDDAKRTNSNLKAVTIAAGEYDDKDLAGRIEDLNALRKSRAANSAISAERGRFYPPNGHQAPGDAGIHLLTNSPFKLQADRTIVPRSVAESNGYDYVDEGRVAGLPKSDKGRLIAWDDGRPEDIQKRFGKLLENMNGTVVICPPGGEEEQLKPMMMAVLDACDNNPKLSVSFSAPDKEQQAELTRAYRSALEDRHENSLESDDDDHLEIPIADLWKKA